MVGKQKESGFTLVELMIASAILLLIATPFVRYFYAEELLNFRGQFFGFLGIGKNGKILIFFLLGSWLIYFKIRPDIIEAKRKNRPVVRISIKIFVLVLLLTAVAMLYFGA